MKRILTERILPSALFFIFGLVGFGVSFGLATGVRTPYDVARDFQTAIAALLALCGALIAFRAARMKVDADNLNLRERQLALARSLRSEARTLAFQAYAFVRRIEASAQDLSTNRASIEGFTFLIGELCKRCDAHVKIFSENGRELTASDIDSLSSLMQRFEGMVYDLKLAQSVIRMFPQAQPGPRLAAGVQFLSRSIRAQIENVAAEFPGALEEWRGHLENVDALRAAMIFGSALQTGQGEVVKTDQN